MFALARHLNECVFRREVIPANLYDGTTVPSAELSGAQDVTKGLGDPIRYGYHDAVLRQMIEYRRHPIDFLEWMKGGELFFRIGWGKVDRFLEYFPTAEDWIRDLEWVERQLRVNYFKRIQAPPIIVVSRRAFGFDLREYQAPEYRPRRYDALRAEVARLDLEALCGGAAADLPPLPARIGGGRETPPPPRLDSGPSLGPCRDGARAILAGMDAASLSVIASVIGVGIALAAVILRAIARLDRRIDRVEDRIGDRLGRVEQGQAELRERMAKLEGLLEGLREAVTGRRAA